MKRKYLLAILVVIGVLSVIDLPRLTSACPAFPPSGSAGDPTNLCQAVPCTCGQSGCHPASQGAGTALTLQIVDSAAYINATANFAPLTSSFKYQPGEAYFIAFELNSGTSGGRYGFQLTALNPDSTMAGGFTVTDATHTHLESVLSGIQYINHHNASSFLNWNFVWDAPVTTKPVTFYYSYNLSDSAALAANLPEGNVFNSSLQIQGTVSGINDLDGRIAELSIFPNPVNKDFNLSFTLKQSNTVSLNVYTIDGQLIRTLLNNQYLSPESFNQSFDISSLASGIYMVKLNVGEASITRKITKL